MYRGDGEGEGEGEGEGDGEGEGEAHFDLRPLLRPTAARPTATHIVTRYVPPNDEVDAAGLPSLRSLAASALANAQRELTHQPRRDNRKRNLGMYARPQRQKKTRGASEKKRTKRAR